MAKIKKIKENGNLIYPATIGEAVVINAEKKKLSEVLSANKQDIAANAEAIEALQQTVEAGGSYPFYVAMRLKGSASPKFTKFYGSKDGLAAVLKHFRLGVIKDGKLNKECKGARLTLSTNGDEIKIDGTDGDVCVYTDTTLYGGSFTAEIDGQQYNAIGLGLVPFTVGGKVAKKIKPFFFSADYTVNTKLEGDTVTKAYCIYNENVAGSYSALTASNTLFKEVVKPNGNGYPSQYVSGLQSGEYARNKNTDTQSNSPYMGLYFRWYEVWMMAMYAELGTLDFCADSLFGTGCASTTPAAAKFPSMADGTSGVKIIQSDGTVRMASIMSQSFRVGAEGNLTYNLDGICGGGHYDFLESLVHNRIMDNIIKNGLTDYVGNADAVFTDMGANVVTDGSVQLDTGEGMEAGKYYIQVRDVDGCEGLKDGVQTGVINMYMLLNVADGVYFSDGTTDLTGAKAIYKFCLPVYRGVCWFKGMFTQAEGIYYRQTNPEGTMITERWSVDKVEDCPVVRTTSGYYNGAELEEGGLLKGMTKKWSCQYSEIQGWQKDMDYDDSMHAGAGSGAGQDTYECGYIYCDASWGAPQAEIDGTRQQIIDSTGKIKQGQTCVNSSALGCVANHGQAGRTLSARSAVSSGNDHYAGALAGFLEQ